MRFTFGIIFLLIFSSISQAQILFEKPFSSLLQPTISDIVEKTAGGFYVCGKTQTTNPASAYLAELNDSGNVIWERTYSVTDSDYAFDQILVFDSATLMVQSSANLVGGGFYAVPRNLKLDTIGNILDSIYVDITGVYNETGNLYMLKGANNTFWVFTFIGTIGIENQTNVSRRNSSLQQIDFYSYSDFLFIKEFNEQFW
jgi:hypothetical protein